MRRALLVAALSFLAWPAECAAFQYSFATPIPDQQKVEHALSFQVNRQVARHWSVDPVSFVKTGGVVISVLPAAQVERICQDALATGCHGGDRIYIEAHMSLSSLTMVLSHEVIETEVDHYSDTYIGRWLMEACDAVEYRTYRLFGIVVSDFIYPSWFFDVRHGPFDQMGVVKRALRATEGAMPPMEQAA